MKGRVVQKGIADGLAISDRAKVSFLIKPAQTVSKQARLWPFGFTVYQAQACSLRSGA
jgi:hypothetical protein